MTWFFPDLNVWLALIVKAHPHNAPAWNWMNALSQDDRFTFSRYTQLGILRLLTNDAAMGSQTLTLREAWDVYDDWLADPRVAFHAEPPGLDAAFRHATAPFLGKPATKWIGDCYLLAYARQSGATLATFDRALLTLARKQGCAAATPA
jgi:toxin-antitoxin system PIN domain toxin